MIGWMLKVEDVEDSACIVDDMGGNSVGGMEGERVEGGFRGYEGLEAQALKAVNTLCVMRGSNLDDQLGLALGRGGTCSPAVAKAEYPLGS